jgi:hypothetical protein
LKNGVANGTGGVGAYTSKMLSRSLRSVLLRPIGRACARHNSTLPSRVFNRQTEDASDRRNTLLSTRSCYPRVTKDRKLDMRHIEFLDEYGHLEKGETANEARVTLRGVFSSQRPLLFVPVHSCNKYPVSGFSFVEKLRLRNLC